MFVKFHFLNIFVLKKYQLVYSCGWFSTRCSSTASVPDIPYRAKR